MRQSDLYIMETTDAFDGTRIHLHGPHGSIGWFEGIRIGSADRIPHEWVELKNNDRRQIKDFFCIQCGIRTYCDPPHDPKTANLRANRINCPDFLAISILHE